MVKRKEANGKGVRESRAAYVTPALDAEEERPLYVPLMETRLSGKNQITLPVKMTRILDWRPGDRISMMLYQEMIVLSRLPRDDEDWNDFFLIDNPEWSTKEKIHAWVREGRDSQDREWDQE